MKYASLSSIREKGALVKYFCRKGLMTVLYQQRYDFTAKNESSLPLLVKVVLK